MKKENCIDEFMLLPEIEETPFLLDNFENFFIFENLKNFKDNFYRDGQFYCIIL